MFLYRIVIPIYVINEIRKPRYIDIWSGDVMLETDDKKIVSEISERLSLEDWKRASPKDIPNGLPDTQFLINQKYCLFMFARNGKCYISIFLKDSLIEVAAFEMNIEEYNKMEVFLAELGGEINNS